VVTRPARQAAALVSQLAALDATPVVFPAIAILPPTDPAPLARAHACLAEYDAVIFVSANAAEYGAPGRWPANVAAFATGPGTAAALTALGVGGVRIPDTTFDTEGLLALPALSEVAGKRIVIFRGEGGRECLAESLRARGATVRYAEVYRRVPPRGDLAKVVDHGEIAVVVVTSEDALRNLIAMADAAGRRDWLLGRRLAVISERVAQRAAAFGFVHRVLVAPRAGDQGLVDAIAAWRRGAQAAQ